MQEIRCPKCGEVFQVDESGYAAIVEQGEGPRICPRGRSSGRGELAADKESAVRLTKMAVRSELSGRTDPAGRADCRAKGAADRPGNGEAAGRQRGAGGAPKKRARRRGNGLSG